MATRPHPTFVKGLTIAMAITLLSGFVLFRHHSGARSGSVRGSALVIDSPDTKAGPQQSPTDSVHVETFFIDESLPSSKSGMVVPPDHPALQQQQIRVDSSYRAPSLPSSKSAVVFPPEDDLRRMLYSSKSGAVFEQDLFRPDSASNAPATPSFMVNDSVLHQVRSTDTIE